MPRPILAATDAALWGTMADGVIIVYQVGKIARGALKRAKAQLDNVKARIIGVVLNGLKAEISPDYEYHDKYYYYYGSERKKKLTIGERIASLPDRVRRYAGSIPGKTKSPGEEPAEAKPRSGSALLRSLLESRLLKIVLLLLALGLLAAGLYYIQGTSPSIPAISVSADVPDLSYTVQVDATQYLRIAREKVEELKSKGYDAHREMVDLKREGVWYRIYIGRFASEEEARRYILTKEIHSLYPRYKIRRLGKKNQPPEKKSVPQ